MTTNDKYIEIPWGKVRKGDLLQHENGDRVTVTSVWSNLVDVTAGGSYTYLGWDKKGYEPYRKLPALPQRPGLYVSDSDPNPDVPHTYRRFQGGTWESDRDGTWSWIALHEVPTDLVPLVTMPTLEQVTNALPWDFPEDRYEEVMDALRSIFGQQGEE